MSLTGLLLLQVGLDDESFENYRSGLIAKKLEKDPSLTYETNHLWGQIVDKRYYAFISLPIKIFNSIFKMDFR